MIKDPTTTVIKFTAVYDMYGDRDATGTLGHTEQTGAHYDDDDHIDDFQLNQAFWYLVERGSVTRNVAYGGDPNVWNGCDGREWTIAVQACWIEGNFVMANCIATR